MAEDVPAPSSCIGIRAASALTQSLHASSAVGWADEGENLTRNRRLASCVLDVKHQLYMHKKISMYYSWMSNDNYNYVCMGELFQCTIVDEL